MDVQVQPGQRLHTWVLQERGKTCCNSVLRATCIKSKQPTVSLQEQFLYKLTTSLEVCNALKDSVISLLRDNTLEQQVGGAAWTSRAAESRAIRLSSIFIAASSSKQGGREEKITVSGQAATGKCQWESLTSQPSIKQSPVSMEKKKKSLGVVRGAAYCCFKFPANL